MRPETTGETENGRSISVVSSALPLKLYLATAQAAATPKTRLAGTAIAATISVSLIADMVSGSTSACRYPSTPRWKASVRTTSNGKARNSSTNNNDTVISTIFTASDSVVGE